MSYFRVAVFLFVAGLVSAHAAFAASVTALPDRVVQGEPVLFSLAATSSVRAAVFDGASVPTFLYNGGVHALVGVDIKKPAGIYPLRVMFENGATAETSITIIARERIEAPLGIPEKLGGNTTAGVARVLSSLANENALLAKLRTGTKAFWTKPFGPPLRTPLIVTDPYGYDRDTIGATITHKGTDFRAEEYTRARAMNRGVVRLARTLGIYGKTVVVDHGLGLQTMYMHLSRIDVNVGQLVLPGQILGLSGQTGYAESPHLHVTVRIGDVSIDPVKFLAFFGVAPTSSVRSGTP